MKCDPVHVASVCDCSHSREEGRGETHMYTSYTVATYHLSTVAKAFTEILNTWLSAFMERNHLFCDEQNGFWQLMSCLYHIYTLTTIVHNISFNADMVFCTDISEPPLGVALNHFPFLQTTTEIIVSFVQCPVSHVVAGRWGGTIINK